MGMSAQATLFFGYCWHEEGVELIPGEDVGDWPELYLAKRGEKDPWDDYPTGVLDKLPYEQKRVAQNKWIDDNDAALSEWRRRKAAVEYEFGVDVHFHGHVDYAVPYLAVEESRVHVYSGEAKELPDIDWQGDNWHRWQVKLDAWLAEFGVEKPQPEPGWWLVASYG